MKFTLAVDYYDLIWRSAELFDEQHIDRFLGRCAEHGINAIQWRLSVCGQLLYRTKTGDMFTDKPCDFPESLSKFHEATYNKCKTILEHFDPLEVVVRLAHKHGMELYPWLTIYDDYGVQGDRVSSIVEKYPERCWRSYDGTNYYLGVTSYVYPEVVEFRMKQIMEILSYGGDGLYLSNRSHSRTPEYHNALDEFVNKNPDVCYTEWIKANVEFIEESQKAAIGTYGFDLPAVEAYIEATGKQPEISEQWNRFRGKYFMKFIEQVRSEVIGKLSFGLRYEPDSPHFLYGKHFFDWERLINENILDELHYALPEDDSVDLKPLYPGMFKLSKTSKQAWCWLGHKRLEDTIRYKANIIRQQIEQGNLDGVVLFEAYHFLEKPDYWKLLDYFLN
ncbi:MAG: family 10 glycosylhydrolase [Victivallaceae bacterium]|nr:family 10 glycosylhydrolase [Victivallaceae bacterium]